jgi:SH3-like domain-containing protein
MKFRVTENYLRVYADPIAFERGEAITRERPDPEQPGWWWCTDKRGKSGWVHESFFEEDDFRFIALADYSALEMNAVAGDEVEVIDERAGWAWCANAAGEQGWLPLSHLQHVL